MTRLVVWAAVLMGIPTFLVLQGEATQMTQIAGGSILLALIAILMFSGRSPVLKPPRKKDIVTVEKPRDEIELPAPVLELEGASERREEKIQRSRGRVAQPVAQPMPAPPEMPMPPAVEAAPDGEPPPPVQMMPDDGSQVATRFVAESDPQIDEESEVEAFVGDRRLKRAEIRSKIERKRRMDMASRRAAKVGMWSAVEDGEDIAALLKDPNHGLTVLDEPESADPSKPQGVSYVRIDENRVLKVRVPLELPEKKQAAPPAPEIPETPPLSPPDDMPPPPGMPPMPPPPDMPPMPPQFYQTGE